MRKISSAYSRQGIQLAKTLVWLWNPEVLLLEEGKLIKHQEVKPNGMQGMKKIGKKVFNILVLMKLAKNI